MKRKKITMLLAGMMLMLAGCSGTTAVNENGNAAVNEVTVEESGAEKEAEEDTEETVSESEEDALLASGGGSPWIDTDLKSNIREDMVLSPKDDFHLYVNYDWLLGTEIPDGRSSQSSFSQVSDLTKEKALALLSDDSLTGHDAELIQSYYNAILDWDARNEAGLDPIMDTVRDIQGISSLDELSAFICDPDRSRFVPVFVSMGNMASFDDAESYIAAIENTGYTLSDAAEYRERTEMGERYYEACLGLTKEMLTRLGYSETEAEEMFEATIDLEGKLAEVALTEADWLGADIIDKINNVYKPDELKDFSSTFPLTDYIKNHGFENAERFLVIEPAVMDRLNELYTEDNLDAIKNYLLVRYVRDVANILDREAYDAYAEAKNIINGSSGREKDEIVAFNMVRKALSTPMARAYLERYDASEKKERITKICEDVIAAYREMLGSEDWMSDETKNKAIEKLDAIKINAVYPEKWTDYSGLNLQGLSVFECVSEIYKFDEALNLAKLNGRVDHEIWDFNILMANAYYNQQDNSITIVLGILDEPFYFDGISDEELLGGIGTVIGHEISHAFDTMGAQYDKDGNYANWWKEEDYEAFKERADKLVSYYDSITVWEGQNVIGANIRDESIADMAGIKSMLMIAENTEDFDYDKFFTAYATTWHEIDTREAEYTWLTQDPHPLSYLRTNVVLQQYDEFFETYDIKEGDNMYLAPEDRVAVW